MTPATSTNGFATGTPDKNAHEHAIDFATHSWDLATSGLKTMTAKRELPTRADRRSAESLSEASLTRSYTVILVVLICVVLMLLGGGVVLFILLQP